jgi:hypothetical protein
MTMQFSLLPVSKDDEIGRTGVGVAVDKHGTMEPVPFKQGTVGHIVEVKVRRTMADLRRSHDG